MENDKMTRAMKWLIGRDVGASSKALLAASWGAVSSDWGSDYPRDGGDFGRCLRLLEMVPEAKDGFAALAERCPYWHGLIAKWDEVALALKEEDAGTRPSGYAYKLMRSIFDPIRAADPRYVRA